MGCLVATQLHLLDFVSFSSVGFVVISNDLIAASKSANAVDWPAIGTPPDIETFVTFPLFAGFGVDVRDTGVDFGFDFFDRPSDMR
jgi:hypothetical protein